MTLLVDEACWLRLLPQALTEAEANSEIYRKGQCLPLPSKDFQKVGPFGSVWPSS